MSVICYNLLLCLLMLWVGMKVIQLFLVALPLVLMLHIASPLSSFFAPHILWLPLSLALILYYCAWRYSPPTDKRQHKTCWGFWELSAVGAGKRLLTILLPTLLVVSLTYWIMERGCYPCTSTPGFAPGILPTKPSLIGHRGCNHDAPENSMVAFKMAATIPDLVGLETDVHYSLDGVGFLMHDPFLVRTTDVRSQCHTIKPRKNASLLYFHNGTCPLHMLNVGKKFVDSNTNTLTKETLEVFKSQTIATFKKFLEVAKNAGKSVIFDLNEPPVGHPYHETYINRTLSDIIASGISLNKVMWLLVPRRNWVQQAYPDFIQTAKTSETSFHDMLTQHIQKVNDDWSTPLSLFRHYQNANISLNMFFVSSPFMLDYAWCVGVQTVTTDNCRELSSVHANTLHQASIYLHT